MFVLKIVVDGAPANPIEYKNVDEMLNDRMLQILFENGHIGRCEIYADNMRVLGIPFMSWDRLRESVKANRSFLDLINK